MNAEEARKLSNTGANCSIIFQRNRIEDAIKNAATIGLTEISIAIPSSDVIATALCTEFLYRGFIVKSYNESSKKIFYCSWHTTIDAT